MLKGSLNKLLEALGASSIDIMFYQRRMDAI